MTTETAAVAAIVQASTREPFIYQDERTGKEVVMLPTDWQGNVQELRKTDHHGIILDPPSRVVERTQLSDRAGFIEYLNKYKQQDTIVFGDVNKGVFAAVIDYHNPAEVEGAFKGHQVILELAFAEEWKRWMGQNANLVDQETFARFVLENQADVVKPSSSDLYEMALDLNAIRTGNFKRRVRLENGDERFEFSEETQITSKAGENAVDVPREFVLSLPVFYGEPNTELKAFLRWRTNGQKLSLGYELHRVEFVKRAVFNVIATAIREAVQVPVLMGPC